MRLLRLNCLKICAIQITADDEELESDKEVGGQSDVRKLDVPQERHQLLQWSSDLRFRKPAPTPMHIQ